MRATALTSATAAALLGAAWVLLVPAGGAAAAPASAGWAQWSAPEGSTHDFRGSMQLPATGFPAASWTSDSRSPVQVPSGASAYLPASTPPGARYGSSPGRAYLNLRPYADNATSPSTTTFDFASATPSAGWTFVLGDVDADQVHVAARDADGRTVPDSDISTWERGSFNYAGGSDRPTWHPDTATLVGNPAAADTNGASDWFEPDRALSSLTFAFTQRSGFPVYQLWFATLAHDVTGSVTGTTQCPASSATVHLVGPGGDELSSTHPQTDGSYTFAGYPAQPGYTVAVDAPATPADGCEVVGAARQPVDLGAGNATADFALRDVVPRPVGGTVLTTDGTAVPGVSVTLTPPSGTPRTVVTDDTGRYLFDANALGTDYRVAVTAPDGYTGVPPTQRTFDITNLAVPDQNFVVRALPSISGTISDAAGPVADVPVTLTELSGTTTRTVTDADGQYRFARVPDGTYAISVVAPAGYAPPQDRENVTVSDADRTGQDFTLTRVGSVAGTVTDAAGPVADVPVTVHGPSGDDRTRTAADGTYSVADLDPATYTVSVDPPGGFTVTGAHSRTATITTAGELRGGLDFTVARVAAAPSPTSTAASAPASSAGASGGSGGTTTGGDAQDDALADTGIPVMGLGTGAAIALLLGIGSTLIGRRPRRR